MEELTEETLALIEAIWQLMDATGGDETTVGDIVYQALDIWKSEE